MSQGMLELKGLGKRSWFNIQWPAAIMPSGSYWLTLQSAHGSVLWLGEPDLTAHVVTCVVDKADSSVAQGKKISAFRTFFNFIVAAQSGDSGIAALLTERSVRLSIGQNTVPGIEMEGNKRFDLAVAASAIIPDGDHACVQAVSSTKAVVTFYPPLIRYTTNS